MKILMTADTVGGVWTYVLELAQALEHYGVHISLATMGAPISEQQRAQVRALDNVEVFESDYKLEWMDDPWQDVERAGEWLLELSEQVQPDVVHLNGYAHGHLPWQAPVVMVAHSCVLSWWRAVKGEDAPGDRERYHREVQRGLQAADTVAAPTQAMLNAILEHYGPVSESAVIANGRNEMLFAPAAKEAFILSAGRLWDEAKNVQALELAAANLTWPVLVAGGDRHPNGQRAEPQNVQLLGSLAPEALAQWLGRAAIYALPARYEPFGLSALEAALSGCALVLGDIPSLREVWGDAARFVPPDDTDELTEVLQQLADDAPLRKAMGQVAMAKAREYSAQRMGREYFDLYGSLQQRKAEPVEEHRYEYSA